MLTGGIPIIPMGSPEGGPIEDGKPGGGPEKKNTVIKNSVFSQMLIIDSLYRFGNVSIKSTNI